MEEKFPSSKELEDNVIKDSEPNASSLLSSSTPMKLHRINTKEHVIVPASSVQSFRNTLTEKLSERGSKQKLWNLKRFGSVGKLSSGNSEKTMIDQKAFGMDTYDSDMEDIEYKDMDEYGPDVYSSSKDNSIIPEVAATVPITDDTTIPTLTFRVVMITTFLVSITTFASQFYFFRLNQVNINSLVHTVVAYPMGKFLELVKGPRWFNPGPFSYKEHALIVLSSTSAITLNYGTIALVIQRLFYGKHDDINKPDVDGINIGILASILFLFTCNAIGTFLGGLFEKILVYPAKMWWPANLVYVNLIHTFHGSGTRKITNLRLKMFMVALAAAFVYEFIPQFFAPLLYAISFLCLFSGGGSRNLGNELIHQFGSVTSGGVLSFSFSWQAVSSYMPMVTPLWAQMNYLLSGIFVTWILIPLLYHSNLWEAKKFPVYGRDLYNMEGTSLYNISSVIDPKSNTVISNDIPPMRLSMYIAFTFGASFATLSSMVSECICKYYGYIIQIFKTPLKNLSQKDIHARLMQSYPQVPAKWYAIGLACTSGIAILILQLNYSAFQADFWLVPLAVLLGMVFIIPAGVLAAVSNQFFGVNVFSQYIMGYLKPGSILANTTFKVYGTQTLFEALTYVSNMKMAFYMKIPPRHVLIMQLYAISLRAIGF
jgi:OPT family oligopeptide transporter